MPDYIAYRNEKAITNNQFINTLHERYVGFTKIQSSFISHPEVYGLCLTAEAEDVLIKEYGAGTGLEHYKPKPKRLDKRRKTNRMMVRLDDEMYIKVMSLMRSMNFTTVQEFLETTLSVMVSREEQMI